MWDLANAKQEVTLAELAAEQYDWQEVFGEGGGGNCNKKTDVCPPGSSVDPTPPLLKDVTRVVAAVNGANDEEEWVGIFELADGRFVLATGSCDYTGWDCQAGNHLEVAANLDDILGMGLTDEQRTRLGIVGR